LREHADLANAGIKAIREGEIDDSEFPAEWDCRLGSPLGQRVQAAAAPPRQNERHGLPGQTADESSFMQGFWHG
jgi:hypothetical protein